MADEVLKKIAENKIKDLEKEEQKLGVDLKNEIAYHFAICDEYGSELCAGAMDDSERKIHLEINRVHLCIHLLNKFIQGGLDIFQESSLRAQCEELDKEMSRLNSLKDTINTKVEEIDMVRGLLSVKF